MWLIGYNTLSFSVPSRIKCAGTSRDAGRLFFSDFRDTRLLLFIFFTGRIRLRKGPGRAGFWLEKADPLGSGLKGLGLKGLGLKGLGFLTLGFGRVRVSEGFDPARFAV